MNNEPSMNWISPRGKGRRLPFYRQRVVVILSGYPGPPEQGTILVVDKTFDEAILTLLYNGGTLNFTENELAYWRPND